MTVGDDLYAKYIHHDYEFYRNLYKQERFDKGDGAFFLDIENSRGIYVYANNVGDLQYDPKFKKVIIDYITSPAVDKDKYMIFIVAINGEHKIFTRGL